MQQQDPKGDDLRLKILLQSQIKVPCKTKAQFFDKIIPLNENQAFIYFDGGAYEVYDIEGQNSVLQGKIVTDVKYFTQIYPNTLTYLDPEDMNVKLIDFTTNTLNPRFVFEASKVVKQNSDKQAKETLADKFRIMTIDKDGIKYMITQDLEKQYSNNDACHFITRVIPTHYTHEAAFDFSPLCVYDYPNTTHQTELYSWQVDEETFAIFGQDFEVGQAEMLLVKPHLGDKAFYVVHIKDTISYTLINVTNWIQPHKIAIWQNNNDGNAKPTIFTIDIRSYYDGIKWLPEPEYQPTKVRDEYVGAEPVTFMDVYQFQLGSTFILQFRLVGVDPYLSLINYENIDAPELINEVKITDFFHELPTNRQYLLQYNDLEVKDGVVEFSIVFPVDARHQLLQIMEKANIVEKYGINNVEEIFEFYQQ